MQDRKENLASEKLHARALSLGPEPIRREPSRRDHNPLRWRSTTTSVVVAGRLKVLKQKEKRAWNHPQEISFDFDSRPFALHMRSLPKRTCIEKPSGCHDLTMAYGVKCLSRIVWWFLPLLKPLLRIQSFPRTYIKLHIWLSQNVWML